MPLLLRPQPRGNRGSPGRLRRDREARLVAGPRLAEPGAGPLNAANGSGGPDRWERVGALFDAACKLPPEERESFLREACGEERALGAEVASLLEAGAREGPADRLDAVFHGAAMERALGIAGAGTRVGPYRLVRLLGHGGMGVVYLAERVGDFRQRVALKLLRTDLTLESPRLDRFLEERQILAGLAHPHIARLLDGGVTGEGIPWFAMEVVDGTPIDRFCDHHGLSVEDRLALFLQVCDAVQYAHQNLVVHRDLKPGNVLVTDDRRVKLLDFGIAKLLADAGGDPTHTHHRHLTPGYASPEQVRGESVTTASDTYSLAVLLYRLLTARSPYPLRGELPEVARTICEVDPESPSSVVVEREGLDPPTVAGEPATVDEVARVRDTEPERLRRRLRGDLDTILLKGLRKAPDRRYPTAGEFAADVRRHLDGLPVRARPDTTAYRTVKFVRRHRLGALAVAALALVLLAGVTGVGWQARRAAAERDRAEIEADKAEQVAGFLVDLFEVSDPAEALGREITARELLERGAIRLGDEGELASQPVVRAALLDVLGQVHRKLGRNAEARPLLERALELRRAHLDPDDSELAESLSSLGLLALDEGRHEEAEPLLREALSIRRSAHGDVHDEVAAAFNDVGAALLHAGRLDEAEAMLRAATDLRVRLGEERAPATATHLDGLGMVSVQRGDLAAADSFFTAALEIRRARLVPRHPDLVRSLNNVGTAKLRNGDPAAAEPYLREALATWREVLGEHLDVARALNNLGSSLEAQGELEEAEEAYRESLEMKQSLHAGDHATIAFGLNNLGLLLRKRGEIERAESLLVRSLAMRRRLYGPEHPSVAAALHNLASLHRDRGEIHEAATRFREALEQRRGSLGEDNPATIESAVRLAAVLHEMGRDADAEPLLEDALSAGGEALAPDDSLAVEARRLLETVRGEKRGFPP